jgi:hypothetical protein
VDVRLHDRGIGAEPVAILEPLGHGRAHHGCAYRSIAITQIGPSRSPGSVDRDHQDRWIVITEIGIVITQIGPS